MFNRHLSCLGAWVVALLLMLAATGSALADPPGRVARLSYVGGEVSMQPAGLDEWSEAQINRPLITGDTLYSDRAARVEMEIGAATIRLDERTAFRLLNLDDNTAQIELTSGTLNLTVRHVFEGQTYEVDTPSLALVIQTPGQYRVDIAPEGDSTMVSVVDGNGDVYGRDNASFRVSQGESYRFHDAQLKDYEVFDLPEQDEFDRWCYERTDRYNNSPSRQYVADETIGYADLDGYGSWSSAPSYGSIWYPSHLDAGWTPYRDGHWAWIDPWGWTWVDNAPWGFAPSHYGRWAQVNSRWGWVPGPRHVRPIYAPALVAFVGGGGFSVGISVGGPVGWFPLGPRDVYVPWYHGSRDYFNNINVRNTTTINNTYITNVYNDYSNGRPINNPNYAYQNNQNAYTAVSRDTFTNARSVNSARVQVDRAQLSQGRVVSRIEVAPTRRSLAGSNAKPGNPRNIQAASFDRQVIARTAPPERRLDAQERIQAISRNNNQPLAIDQMHEMSAKKPRLNERQAGRVEVVGGERPSATAVPTRAGNPGNGRVQRQQAGSDRARTDNQRGSAPEANRVERSRDATPSGTVHAPQSGRLGRSTAPVQTDRADNPAERANRSTTRQPSVERDASSRTIHAPAQSQPSTIRAPGSDRKERNTPSTPPNPSVDRVERSSRTPTPRPADERDASPRTIHAPAQRQAAERQEPVRSEPEPMRERREKPQSTPRPVPQQERRAVEPRSIPQAENQPAPERQRRESQPRSAPPAQQQQAAPAPAQNPPARRQKPKTDEDSKDEQKDDQRKHRDRN